MRVSAKADYAVRAAIELASQPAALPVKAEQIAVAQDIPLRFLENILAELRHGGIVETQLGTEGGHWLTRPAADITVAEVMRAVEGDLASVHSKQPDAVSYLGSSKPLRGVWMALRANVRIVLESVTLADVVAGALPEPISALAEHPEATAAADPGASA